VSIERLETGSILEFLNSLQPPVHVILLCMEPTNVDEIESEMMVGASSRATSGHAADQLYGFSLRECATSGWVINRVGRSGWVINRVGRDALSDLTGLIRLEERIRDERQPQMALCTYPLMHLIELAETSFIDILSLHDYILFSRFEEGRRILLEAVDEALKSSLGGSGSEMLYRFARNMDIEREQIPGELRRFRLVLRELLGIGANVLERFIFRRLYLKLSKSPQVACVDE